MYVVASFKLNKNLERSIAELEFNGINRKKILALPLAVPFEQNIHDSYKKKLFETAPILVTIFALFGSIYGFILKWGPVLWGLIGVGLGIIIGVVFDFLRTKKMRKEAMFEDRKLTEVFLLIHCSDEDQAAKVKALIVKWSPLGISTYCKS